MPASTPRPQPSGALVTAVLVSHDGAEWLPETLAAVASQSRPPDRLVAVDTSSRDGSPEIIASMLGAASVVSRPRDTAYGDAVQAGLDASNAAHAGVGSGDDPVEWVWLLHDDCAPEPDALAALLDRVERAPSIWLAGPKVCSWDGGRLLEVGISIDLSGRIDTGLDGAELDQGQRDDADDVLAVGTAGALVRRDVWQRLGGLERAWARHGDDADLGWRVNAAGGRVVVAPRAVVRHAAALGARRRHTDLQRRRLDVEQRRHGMQVVLANVASPLVPVLVVRYVVAAVLRALALLLLARQPAAARVELVAMTGVLRRLAGLRDLRRRRATTRTVRHRDLRALFPAPGSRWRHSLGRLAAAAPGRAGGAGRPQPASYETGPVAAESESLAPDDSLVERVLRRPGVAVFAVTALLALVADRHVLSTTLHGGRLLLAPGGAGSLWATYLASWHPVSVGSTSPAPPAVAVLALLSTVAFGKAWLAVDVILLAAVPLAASSAYVALGPFCRSPRVRAWAAVSYSVLPPLTGAVATGRLDVTLVAILLPVTARAVAAAVRADPRHGGWHRCAGAGLLLAVMTALAPVLWPLAALVLLATVAASPRSAGAGRATLRRLLASVLLLAVAPVVLVPWTAQLLRHPVLLVSGFGLPEQTASRQPPSGLSLLLLHAGGPGQPAVWLVAPLLLAALLGLLAPRRRQVARVGAALLVAGAAGAVALTRSVGVRAGAPDARWWPGAVLLAAGAGMLLSATVGASNLRPALRRHSFGWRQPAAALLGLVSIASTAALAVGWLHRGAGDPLTGSPGAVVPVFTQAELAQPGTPRALVLRARGSTVDFALVRRPSGPRLGDADVEPPRPRGADAAARNRLATTVSDLASGRPDAGGQLVPFAVTYVVVPTGGNARLGNALAKVGTLSVVPVAGATVYHSSLPAGELTVASPGQPARRVLPVRGASPSVTVPPGPTGRVLILAEPANTHWQATVNGHSLTASRVDGWSQAWRLPPGGGRLHVSFHDPGRGLLLAVQLALLAVVTLLAVPATRRDRTELAR